MPFRASLCALVLLLAAPAARAAGFASARFGGELGHPTTASPTALYYNPAGIALSPGGSLYLDGVLALRAGSWQHELPANGSERPDPDGATGANVGRASFRNVFGGPMLGVSTRLGDLALGGAFFVPFGGRSQWDENPTFVSNKQFPLARDGIQRWHNIEGAITVAYLTAGVGYRLGPLALGATVNLIRSSVDQRQAKNVVGNGEPDTSREGRAELSVRGLHGSFGLGFVLEPLPDQLWIGASYQAQPGLGEMQLHGTLTTTYAGASSPFDVTFRQALPDVMRAGLRLRPIPALELRAHGDITRWSVLQTQCVSVRDKPCAIDPSGADITPEASTVQVLRRRWRNTWSLRGGASYWPTASVEIFAGGGAEKGAPPAATLDPSLIDADNVQGAVGLRVALASTWYLGGSFTRVHYFPRDNTGRSELGLAQLPARRADGGGRYELALTLLQTSLEKRF